MTAARTAETLAEAATRLGQPFEGGANRPVDLDDPETVWYVEHGSVDLFLVERDGDDIVSSPRHLLRAGQGRMLFGMSGHASPLRAVAKGTPGARLHRVRVSSLDAAGAGALLADQADLWVDQFAAGVAARIEPRPTPDFRIAPGAPPTLVGTGSVVSAGFGTVAWVRCAPPVADGSTRRPDAPASPPALDAMYLGTEPFPACGAGVPVSAHSWVTVVSECMVRALTARQLQAEGRLPGALAQFHELVLQAESLIGQLALVDQVNEQKQRAADRHSSWELARRRLAEVGARRRRGASPAAGLGSGLAQALEAVGRREGVVFAPARPGPDGAAPTIPDVLRSSGIRGRRVTLRPGDRWWLGDSGSMVAFLGEDRAPVALLPSRLGRYRMLEPGAGRIRRVDRRIAARLAAGAWAFIRPLPADAPVGGRTLLRAARSGTVPDLARFALAGLAVSALMFVPAAVVGALAERVLPAGASRDLFNTVVMLVMLAVLAGLLHLAGGTAMMRVEGRSVTRLAAALWDRLLDLPPGFLDRFTAGDLASRLAVFNSLRDRVIGAVTASTASVVFLLPTFAVMLAYDATLAWSAAALALVALTAVVVMSAMQLGPQRDRFRAGRRLTGDLLQFVGGISKLRSAGAENSALARWADVYRHQQLARIRADRINEHLNAMSAALPALAAAVLFAAALWRGAEQTGVGDFLVVFAASATFFAALRAAALSFEVVSSMLPAYEEIKPVLEAVPERRASPHTAAPALSGELQIDRVSFQYDPGGPQILDDVSLHAHPGEFVAVVGESGAGKSTVLKLALGLADPKSGAVYYDGRDLSNLDTRSVRRQVGVVMQGAATMPGNILDNIIGFDSDLNIDDAWEAARMAAVADDIEAMPMGMFTSVGDDAAGFSGGQIQRIKIAAALVRKPRILFMDEATSWLDAESQAEVMATIETLTTTRFVIAHRISTLAQAGRIYVLDAGRVVQQGAYAELLDHDGPFRRLVQRQLL